MRHLILFSLLLGCGGKDDGNPAGDSGTSTTPAPRPFAGHPIIEADFMNVAHRGGGMLAPEMTMEAMDNAVAVGADMLEVDVWSTSDGVLILMHDDTVDRTTDGTGAVVNLTWDEISQLDAAYHYSEDGGTTFPLRGTGITVPRLEDVLAAYPDIPMSIEVKQQAPSIVDPLLALMDQYGPTDRFVVGSFEPTPLNDIRAQRPEILTSMSATDGLSFFYNQDPAYVPPTYYLAAPTSLGDIVLDASVIDRAHDLGIVVHVWTINDPTEMTELIGWGADGIITDDPATLEGLAP